MSVFFLHMIMVWTAVHNTFAIETFSKTDESVISTQRAYHVHFMLHRNDVVLDRKSILLQDVNCIQRMYELPLNGLSF